jgi:hypothetical protein
VNSASDDPCSAVYQPSDLGRYLGLCLFISKMELKETHAITPRYVRSCIRERVWEIVTINKH